MDLQISVFEMLFKSHLGGIDTFYAPYIRMNGKLVNKSSYQRGLQPENNSELEVIPQIMTNDADEFLFVVKYIQELGYKELNWNLGCPYPMVTKRGMGSGLICEPEKINHILDGVHSETDIVVSIKINDFLSLLFNCQSAHTGTYNRIVYSCLFYSISKDLVLLVYTIFVPIKFKGLF